MTPLELADRVDVPWNASWSDEERFEIRPCRYANGMPALWQPFNLGSGKPIFAKPHAVRQRRSIAEMRCTVCGEKTSDGDRWWFALGNLLGDKFVTTEAPVHGACAQRAMDVCPHLRKLGRAPLPFPYNSQVLASVLGGPDVERDFGIRIAPGRVVIGQLKLSWPASYIADLLPAALRAGRQG